MSSNDISIISFWSRQISQIKENGWVAVRFKVVKILTLPIDLIGYTLAVPVVLFVRLIRPLVWIRFGPVHSRALGHSVFDPEYYLCEREIENSKTVDCFYFDSRTSPNEQWALMVQRNLRINPVFRYVDKVSRLFPNGEARHKLLSPRTDRDFEGYIAETEPHIIFTTVEDSKGRLFLKELGIKPSVQYVCLIGRDSAYKEKYRNPGNRKDWSYHNYRDSDIDTYKTAALALAEKGYWVFRMGKAVHERFDPSHPQIIDYANSEFRSDFLDIWLMANCYFTISNGTGLDSVSYIFRKPIVFVNQLPVMQIRTGPKDVANYFKILQWKKNGEYLSLRDQINCGAINFSNQSDYDRLGIKIVDNTSTQIRNAVLDFEKQLSSNFTQQGDNVLQERFWQIMKEHEDFLKYHGKYSANISDVFLEEHHEWFLA
jgi:putative glycosyltransferase (TIGR04372 family)